MLFLYYSFVMYSCTIGRRRVNEQRVGPMSQFSFLVAVIASSQWFFLFPSVHLHWNGRRHLCRSCYTKHLFSPVGIVRADLAIFCDLARSRP